jgi:acetylglutamate kinase
MRRIVVKFGGHAMSDEHGAFAEAIREAQLAQCEVIVVHGGGPQINKALEKAGISSDFVGGFRVTTSEVFEVVEKVLATEVGPAVALSLHTHGIAAQAISGRAGILFADRQTTLVDGTEADLGRVGRVTRASVTPIESLLAHKVVPVISPIAQENGTTDGLNVNADIAAAAIAGAAGADDLIIMTDVAGIYLKWPDLSSLIEEISAQELSAMKGSFVEGMAPKVQACLDAIEAGARSVRIIDGRDSSAFLLAVHGRGGTKVVA